jgi:hypothetical protein
MDKFAFQQDLTRPTPKGRGCGNREKFKLYITFGLSSGGGGSPWQEFMIDPVIPWVGDLPRNYDVIPRGDGSDVWDLVLIVGQTHRGGWSYPDPIGFAVEGGDFGISKALSPHVDFEKLTPRQWDPDTEQMIGSRMVFLHPMAYAVGKNFEVGRSAPLPYCAHSPQRGGFSEEAWTPLIIPGYHPIGAAWTPDMQEPTPCTHALRDLAFFIHRDLRTGMLEDYENEDGYFRVRYPSTTFAGKRPAYPQTEDAIAREMFKPGLFMATGISGFEFYKEADPAIVDRLRALGFKVAILDY